MSLRLTLAMDGLPPLFASGQRLGRYQLQRRLAVGGMAEVYLASATGPGDFRKLVAIKRLLPQHALDPQLLRMFLDEGRLMARLSHPHIPQVTDVDDGAPGGVPYFVMEYVHGTDLRGVLNAARGPLPMEHALAITSAVAAGLHHAHEHRGAGGQALEIVHRDVSPSNILISFDGAVKITDFGVAKWVEQKSFTNQGQLKGKFAHMSPEQCRGEVLDRRSDLFALGTLLYEMTTGVAPFVAESEYELLSRIVSHDVAPPRRREPGATEPLPAALEAIVMRSLRRARAERYATAQELQLDLEAFAREHRLVVSPVALAGYLESLFGARVTQWREALASGGALVEHFGADHPLSGEPVSTHQGNPVARTSERTATDAFALLPLASETPSARPAEAAVLLSKAVKGKPRSVGRIVAAVTMAIAALVLVLSAIEVTSRWQQSSSARMSPSPPATRFGAGPASAATSAPKTDGTAGIVPRARLVVDEGETAVPSRRATPPTRASRTALRLARRETSTGAPPREEKRRDQGGHEIAALPRLHDPLLPQAPAVRVAAPASTAAASAPRSAVAPPSATVKLWDPDSPVPP